MMLQSKTNNHLSIINNHCALGTTSTFVESALQIAHFMQNKPNFQKAQMNVSRVSTRDYEKKDTWWSRKNKPNSNPIQTQSNPIKANKMPKQTQYKPKQTQFPYYWLCLRRNFENEYNLYGLSEMYKSGLRRRDRRRQDRNVEKKRLSRLSSLTIYQVLIAGAGFEPATSGLWARRATRLLYPAVNFCFSQFAIKLNIR